MKYEEIRNYETINRTEEEEVSELVESMKENGFIGCPILVFGGQLLTGSHRLAALEILAEEDSNVLNWDVAEDVGEIVEAAMSNYKREYGYCPTIEFDNIGWMLDGTWVEEYKNEISEW